MNEEEKKYMHGLITEYWNIIKAHGTKSKNPFKGQLYIDINDWYTKYKTSAPSRNVEELAQKMTDGLMMFYGEYDNEKC